MKCLPACLAAVAAFLFAAATAPSARADDYPARPVTMIVPYTPGGSTEILARIVGQKLEQRLGKPVIIENKPGAGTVIGSPRSRKSAPDGYTLLMATPTPMAINVTVHKSLPYDPATDFMPLAMVAQRAVLAHGQSGAAGAFGEGAHRLRQSQSGQTVVRLRRRRRAASSLHGAVQEHDRHRR